MTLPSVSSRAVSVLKVGAFVSFCHVPAGSWALAKLDHASKVNSTAENARRDFMEFLSFFGFESGCAVFPQPYTACTREVAKTDFMAESQGMRLYRDSNRCAPWVA